MKKYSLAIIGSGSLGSIIGTTVKDQLSSNYEILGIFSKSPENSLALSQQLACKSYKDLSELIADQPDYLIEAASPQLVKDIGVEVLESGIELIPLSVGALADPAFYQAMEKAARGSGSRVHIPSGAVGGFDLLHSSLLMEEASVGITTEKSPASLQGAPALAGRELSQSKTETLFQGPAKEAIQLFPENVNVAVATALATRGVDQTEVVIKSIPNIKSNNHTIELTGDSIKVSIAIETTPSPDNPKSSSLAAYSVITLLKNLVSPITF